MEENSESHPGKELENSVCLKCENCPAYEPHFWNQNKCATCNHPIGEHKWKKRSKLTKELRKKSEKDISCRVILYNDEVHTFPEVWDQLMKAIPNCSESHAKELSSIAHFGGTVIFEGSLEESIQVQTALCDARMNVDIDYGNSEVNPQYRKLVLFYTEETLSLASTLKKLTDALSCSEDKAKYLLHVSAMEDSVNLYWGVLSECVLLQRMLYPLKTAIRDQDNSPLSLFDHCLLSLSINIRLTQTRKMENCTSNNISTGTLNGIIDNRMNSLGKSVSETTTTISTTATSCSTRIAANSISTPSVLSSTVHSTETNNNKRFNEIRNCNDVNGSLSGMSLRTMAFLPKEVFSQLFGVLYHSGLLSLELLKECLVSKGENPLATNHPFSELYLGAATDTHRHYLSDINNNWLSELAQCTSLTHINLSYGNVSGKGLVCLRNIPCLYSLNLDGIPLFDGDMACFRKGFTSLRELSVNRCYKLTDKCLSYLTGLVSLRRILIRETNISLFHAKRFLSENVTIIKKSNNLSKRKRKPLDLLFQEVQRRMRDRLPNSENFDEQALERLFEQELFARINEDPRLFELLIQQPDLVRINGEEEDEEDEEEEDWIPEQTKEEEVDNAEEESIKES